MEKTMKKINIERVSEIYKELERSLPSPSAYIPAGGSQE